MARYEEDEDGRRGVRGVQHMLGRAGVAKIVLIAVAVLVVVVGLVVWYGFRIQVDEGELVTLLAKTGKDLTNDQILARDLEHKGPQFTVLKEGRHFRNPYSWWWSERRRAVEIGSDKVGILIRRHGEPLEPGTVAAKKDEKRKGIVEEPMTAGRYYINRWEYDVEIHPMAKIEPGFMGVVTLLAGKMPEDPNVFVVAEGERGTQRKLLGEGTHPRYSNPYVHMVTPIDTRSQQFVMAGEDKITFLSKYGFDIEVEGVIEWAPEPERLPELFVKYVDLQDLQESGGINNIQRKLILPYARSFFRTVGGQYRAVDYITGTTRLEVQKEVESRLREACAAEGIIVRSFVIRSTEPPAKIREQYVRREQALRQIDRFDKEIETEIGSIVPGKTGPDDKPVREGGRLAKVLQERRKDREAKLGGIRAEVVVEVRAALQYDAVEVTKATQRLEVARLRRDAASDKAEAVRAIGVAEADVTVMKNKAEAEAARAKVSAFGTGQGYAENLLIKALAPGIHRILSNTDDKSPFARLFDRFTSKHKDQ